VALTTLVTPGYVPDARQRQTNPRSKLQHFLSTKMLLLSMPLPHDGARRTKLS